MLLGLDLGMKQDTQVGVDLPAVQPMDRQQVECPQKQIGRDEITQAVTGGMAQQPGNAPCRQQIVESPAKVKTIKKFLGANYDVEASNGHVRDFPKSQFGIDVEHDFEPKYITIRGKGELLAKLRKAHFLIHCQWKVLSCKLTVCFV